MRRSSGYKTQEREKGRKGVPLLPHSPAPIVFFCLISCAFIILGGCALWRAEFLELGDPRGDIIFSHKQHIEMELDCDMCHTQSAESESALDNNYPKEADCTECHEREECSLCHTNVDYAIHLVPEPTGLIFSHKAHLESDSSQPATQEARRARAESINKIVPFVKDGSLEQQIDCSACHDSVKESAKVADKYPPKMRTCRKCHDISQENCALCHYNLGERDFIPASHYVAWLESHQQMAAAEGEALCGNCHRGETRPSDGAVAAVTEDHIRQEDTRACAECHRGDIWPDAIHDNNRLQSHGIDALANQNVCNSCHQRAECLTCHERRGVSFAVVHEAGWQFDHADKARRQLSSCTACHEEEDCLACHQTISPHPVGWDRDITKQNEHVCSKCHENPK